MKLLTTPLRLLSLAALIAMMHFTSGGRVFAQAAGTPSDPSQRQGQYPPEELELLRIELLNLVDAVKEMSGLLPDNTKELERLATAWTQIQQLSTIELNSLRRALDPSKLNSNGLARARLTLLQYRLSAQGIAQAKSRARLDIKDGGPDSPGFPVAHPFCGPNRTPSSVIAAADAVFFVADSVREVAQDGCKQVAVAAGAGGNTSLACIPVDAVWIAAKAVNEGIHFCDDDFTGEIVDTNYARLGHIHADLEASVANDNTNTANILNAINNDTA